MVNDFISLLFPRCCVISDVPLAKGERFIATSAALALPRFDLYHPLEVLMQRMYTFAPVKHTFAYYKFAKRSRVQRLLHQLKYKNYPEVGELAGMWFGHALTDAGYQDAFDLIIPIPLHHIRQRQRGYNQSDYIAKGISKAMNIPWNANVLARPQRTTTQTRKSRWERSSNVEDAFRLLCPTCIANQQILLVDDVLTTGATLGTGANTLLSGGAATVSVAALAGLEY